MLGFKHVFAILLIFGFILFVEFVPGVNVRIFQLWNIDTPEVPPALEFKPWTAAFQDTNSGERVLLNTHGISPQEQILGRIQTQLTTHTRKRKPLEHTEKTYKETVVENRDTGFTDILAMVCTSIIMCQTSSIHFLWFLFVYFFIT